MKPLIYKFLEKPVKGNSDLRMQMEYSHALNLSVIIGTQTPAINFATLGTQTTTKSGHEGSDVDRNDCLTAGTMTVTRGSIEGSDHDNHNSIGMYLGTQTLTLVNSEQIDSDAQRPPQNN